MVARRTGTPLRQVRFPNTARDVSARVHFQCRLSYNVPTPTCAIACINVCAHVKDPVVHVRVLRLIETLKHPACTTGWVMRLCRSWLSPGKATRISHGKTASTTKYTIPTIVLGDEGRGGKEKARERERERQQEGALSSRQKTNG